LLEIALHAHVSDPLDLGMGHLSGFHSVEGPLNLTDLILLLLGLFSNLGLKALYVQVICQLLVLNMLFTLLFRRLPLLLQVLVLLPE
jgi:hypothetical protein